MLKKTALLLFTGIALTYGALGQKLYLNGYVVNTKGDTLNGMVNFFEGSRVPQKIVFKRFDIATPRNYSPDDIKAFGYKNGSHYESRVVDAKKCFVKCYVKGKISVYANGSKVYVEKDNANLVEVSKDVVKAESGNSYTNYIDLLTQVTSDIKDFEVPFDLPIKARSLSNLVEEYNKKSKYPYQAYTNIIDNGTFNENLYKASKNNLSVGFTAGMKLASISLHVIENPNSDFNFTTGNNSLCFGVFYNQSITKLNNNLAFQVELIYSENNFATYKMFKRRSPVETNYLDITTKQSLISIPVNLVYSFPSGKYSPYVNFGFSYSIIYNTEESKYLDVQKLSNDIYTFGVDEETITRAKDRFSPILGLGVKYMITHSLYLVAGMNAAIVLDFGALPQSVFPKFGGTETFMFKYTRSPTVEMTKTAPIITFRFGVGIDL